jgi:adenylate cyclase
MNIRVPPEATTSHAPARWRRWLDSTSLQRSLRLWSGSFIFVFLFMHLANHALGVFGLAVLDMVQTWRWTIWNNVVATSLLYVAFAVHVSLGLWRIAGRRTFRIPLDEALQIVTGLIIPLFLLPHVIHTRVAMTWEGEAYGFYGPVLTSLITKKAIFQSILVLLAWGHGVLGLYITFRHRAWFARVRPFGEVIAIGLPLLALAGFVAGGREAVRVQAVLPMSAESQHTMHQLEFALQMAYIGLWILFGLVIVSLNIQYLRRKFGARLTFTYRGRGPVKVPRGTSILEASRIHGLPHPSVCRGKGRCSTCRVQVLSELNDLPEPNTIERATLDRIGAPPNVRLACQVRPDKDVAISILVPLLGRQQDSETSAEAERWAAERDVTVLMLDVRAFEVLVGAQQPYELSALVNRLSLELEQAVRNHSGVVSSFEGDHLVAFFDAERPKLGARNAIACLRDIARLVKTLNREMGGALPLPVRVGIGVHSGLVTLARVGETEARSRVIAFGEVVRSTAALKDATKSMLTDCIISQKCAELVSLDTSALRSMTIGVEGLDRSISAYAVSDLKALKFGIRKDVAEAETP